MALVFIGFIAAAAAVFVLPWFVPAPRAVSTSADVGFSNYAAMFGFAAAALWLVWVRTRSGATAPSLLRAERESPPPLPRRIAWPVVAGRTAWILLLGALPPFGDVPVFLWRTAMRVDGAVPYRDFLFPYGPIYVEAPAMLARLGMPLTWTIAITTLLLDWIGLWLLARILRRLALDDRQRGRLFLIAGAALPLYPLGPVAMPVRFLLPIGAVIAAAALEPRSRVRAGAASLAMVLAAAALSPESAAATALALVVYWTARPGATALSLSAGAGLAAAAWVVSQFAPDSIAALMSFARGGNHSPVFPTPFSICCLGAVLIVVAREAAAGVRARDASRLALACASLVMAAGALGNSGPHHVVSYSLGAALLLAPVAAAAGRFGLYAGVATLLLPIGLNATTLVREYQHGLTRGFQSFVEPPAPPADVFAALAPYPAIATPLGVTWSVQAQLFAGGKAAREYFNGLDSVVTREDVIRKLKDLDRPDARYALVPAGALDAGGDAPLTVSDQVLLPVFDALRSRYRAVQTVGAFTLLEKKTPGVFLRFP